jgi:excisionase family DNA binding protein
MAKVEWNFTDERRSPSRGPATVVPAILLGVRAAARALAISERTLWRLTKSGRVPHVRVGRRVLYDVEELRTWVRQLRESPSHA